MGDRTQRARGKLDETKGSIKRQTGRDSGRTQTEVRGAAEELKGKAKNAIGRVRSSVKRNTR